MKKSIKTFEEVIAFHGHSCPGLAIGYRASVIALEELFSSRSEDEELVCIAENDACSVDAVQVVTGCTIGKGNLILREYGKQVYTFILRDGSDAVRISQKAATTINRSSPAEQDVGQRVFAGTTTTGERDAFEESKIRTIGICLTAPADELFTTEHVKPEIPEKAKIFRSVICETCGEKVSESRARVQDGKIVCIPCHEEYLGIHR
jgi:formylmethanofuran dehydrogenase subunit E